MIKKMLKRIIKSESYRPIFDFMELIDIRDNLIISNNGSICVIKIESIDTSFMSKKYTDTLIIRLNDILLKFKVRFQILSLVKPIFMDEYLDDLHEKLRLTNDLNKQKILKKYIRQVVSMSLEGEVRERCYYLMITPVSSINDNGLLSLAEQVSDILRDIQLKAKICSNKELMDLLYVYHNPLNTNLNYTYDLDSQPNIVDYKGY